MTDRGEAKEYGTYSDKLRKAAKRPGGTAPDGADTDTGAPGTIPKTRETNTPHVRKDSGKD